MTLTKSEQMTALCDHLRARREAILLAWRKASDLDPEQTTMHSLARGPFNDHIPEVLDAFEHKLRSRPGGASDQAADREKKREEVKHGLHRWQQGYRLRELIHEWGHLEVCLFEEFESFAAEHPEIEAGTLGAVNRLMIELVNEALSESAAQFDRMQRAEATGRVRDLEKVVARVEAFEHRRSQLIHQAVHDLRGNFFNVNLAANELGETGIPESERVELTTMLQQGTEAVTQMLGELMELARLEAGEDTRDLETFDAAALVSELAGVNQPLARSAGLFLRAEGPPLLMVEGDQLKVRRLMQNLLLNALKYTREGGVVLSWGEERHNWWIMIKDTGPGLLAGPGAPMVVGLKEATASARESDEKAAAAKGEVSHVLTPPKDSTTATTPAHQQLGEGIGLSIVKRICELLDASLEMASSAEAGTTFRVVLPRNYQSPK